MNQDVIQRIPFLQDKTPQFQTTLVNMLQPLHFEKGETIINEGTHAEEMFFLTRGRADARAAHGRRLGDRSVDAAAP